MYSLCQEGESSPGQIKVYEWRTLRDLEVGVCDGFSYDQVKERFPEEYQSRVTNKLRYQYSTIHIDRFWSRRLRSVQKVNIIDVGVCADIHAMLLYIINLSSLYE